GGPGDRYRYRVDGRGPFPDPASRFQPEGVHGPSEVVDPHAFAWSDAGWHNVPREDLVLYELHVGTFSPEGTFAGVEAKLAELADLGINAIELMPLADFPGGRGWGYDGVRLYAPARPTTCVVSSTPPTAAASPCCWTSSTITSVPTATIPEYSAPTTHRSGPALPGAMPLTSTALTALPCVTSSSRTPCTGCTSTTSTACVWTPRTPSATKVRATSSPS